MKYLVLSACLLTPLLADVAPPAAYRTIESKPITIKVLLQKEANSPLIEVKGAYRLYDCYSGADIGSGAAGKRATLKAEPTGIYWGERIPGVHQVRIVPETAAGRILVNGIEYKGALEAYNLNGKLHLINEVDVETFLKASLLSQFSQPLPEEAMNAVAICARTNAYYLTSKTPGSLWHTDASEAGYTGNALLAHKLPVEKAVEQTKNAVLLFEGKPFAATWTKNSAGKTINFSTLFKKSILSPPGVVAPIALETKELHKWQFTVPKHALAKAFRLPDLAEIDLQTAGNSSKVCAVTLHASAKDRELDFLTFQRILGKERLRSNDFTLETNGDSVTFTGYGEGLGVGLCLYSAERLAKDGTEAPQILSTFFPGTKLTRLQ